MRPIRAGCDPAPRDVRGHPLGLVEVQGAPGVGPPRQRGNGEDPPEILGGHGSLGIVARTSSGRGMPEDTSEAAGDEGVARRPDPWDRKGVMPPPARPRAAIPVSPLDRARRGDRGAPPLAGSRSPYWKSRVLRRQAPVADEAQGRPPFAHTASCPIHGHILRLVLSRGPSL